MSKILDMLEQTKENLRGMTDEELKRALGVSRGMATGQEIPVSAWAWYKYAVKEELRRRKKLKREEQKQ